MLTMVGVLEVHRTSPLERLKAAMEATRVEAAANARDGAYHAWIQRFRSRMAERPQEGKDWSSFQTTRRAEEQRNYTFLLFVRQWLGTCVLTNGTLTR